MPSSDISPNLALPFLLPAQAQKHVTHNEALALLDVLAQLVVQAFDATSPPTDPPAGAVWALADSPTGDWAGQGGRLAAWQGGGWAFVTPRQGWRATGLADGSLRLWSGSAWRRMELDNLDGVGIGTAHDATNRLAVAAPATLLTHAGADHRLVLNKATATDTAALLFQSAWSGRAEMGLAGETDFSVKVSPDGATWHTGLRIDRATGAMHVPNGAVLDAPLTGPAVTQDALDTTSGRLVRAGDYGNGGVALPLDPDDCDQAVPGTTQRIGTGTVNKPGPSGLLGTMRTDRWGPNEYTQTLHALIGDGPNITYHRIRTGSGWSEWRMAYDTGNVVGTVSQAGGVPTGAVIEHGSNANGEYVCFADGTQICRITGHVLDYNNAGSCQTDWIFPVGFSSTPTFSAVVDLGATLSTATPALDELLPVGWSNSGSNNNRARLSVRRVAGGTDFAPGDSVRLVSVTAFGRWY